MRSNSETLAIIIESVEDILDALKQLRDNTLLTNKQKLLDTIEYDMIVIDDYIDELKQGVHLFEQTQCRNRLR